MGKFVRVASTGDVPVGEAKYVDVDGEPIAVFHVGEHYYATSDVCTHEEASLSEGDLDGELIECPLHGARFNVRTGEVKSLPAVVRLKTYPVRVVADAVEVEV